MKVITHEARVTETAPGEVVVLHVFHTDADPRRQTNFYGPMPQHMADVLAVSLAQHGGRTPEGRLIPPEPFNA
jgi:hypothetical protein